MSPPGAFVVSLDLELYWGFHDAFGLEEKRDSLLGERRAVELLLELFTEYDVHATWAVVGFLYFKTRDELLAHVPRALPGYRDPRLSPYPKLQTIGADEQEDPFHFGASLLDRIRHVPGQELGTHTFSHYLALEDGQDRDAFRADLESAVKVAGAHGDVVESLVFPRNQVNPSYLSVCAELGIRAYRGPERSWWYRPVTDADNSLVMRGFRLLDSFLPLSRNTYPRDPLGADEPKNIPSSHFLRPYARWRGFAEALRIRRITSDLTHAARHGQVYHLWWHPQNFGANTERNLAALRRVLDHFAGLRDRYGMESLSMRELALGAADPSGPR